MAKVKYRQPLQSVTSNRKERKQRGASSKEIAILYSKNQHGLFIGKKTAHRPPLTERQAQGQKRFAYCECSWKNLTDCQKKLWAGGRWNSCGDTWHYVTPYHCWMSMCSGYKLKDFVKTALRPQGELYLLGADEKYQYVRYWLHNEDFKDKVERTIQTRYGPLTCTTSRTWIQDGITEIEFSLYDSGQTNFANIPIYLYTPKGGKYTGKIETSLITDPRTAYMVIRLYHEDVYLNHIYIPIPSVGQSFYVSFDDENDTDRKLIMANGSGTPSQHRSKKYFLSPSYSFFTPAGQEYVIQPSEEYTYWWPNFFLSLWIFWPDLKDGYWPALRIYGRKTYHEFHNFMAEFGIIRNGNEYILHTYAAQYYASRWHGLGTTNTILDRNMAGTEPLFRRVGIKIAGGYKSNNLYGHSYYNNKKLEIYVMHGKVAEYTLNYIDAKINWEIHTQVGTRTDGYIDDLYSAHWN